MWDWDNDSEPELDIQYIAQSQPVRTSDSDDSENAWLFSHTRVPEEKAKQAKIEEEKAKQARAKPLQPTTAARKTFLIANQWATQKWLLLLAATSKRREELELCDNRNNHPNQQQAKRQIPREYYTTTMAKGRSH